MGCSLGRSIRLVALGGSVAGWCAGLRGPRACWKGGGRAHRHPCAHDVVLCVIERHHGRRRAGNDHRARESQCEAIGGALIELSARETDIAELDRERKTHSQPCERRGPSEASTNRREAGSVHHAIAEETRSLQARARPAENPRHRLPAAAKTQTARRGRRAAEKGDMKARGRHDRVRATLSGCTALRASHPERRCHWHRRCLRRRGAPLASSHPTGSSARH